MRKTSMGDIRPRTSGGAKAWARLGAPRYDEGMGPGPMIIPAYSPGALAGEFYCTTAPDGALHVVLPPPGWDRLLGRYGGLTVLLTALLVPSMWIAFRAGGWVLAAGLSLLCGMPF